MEKVSLISVEQSLKIRQENRVYNVIQCLGSTSWKVTHHTSHMILIGMTWKHWRITSTISGHRFAAKCHLEVIQKCWISHHFNSGPLHEHGCHRTAEKKTSTTEDVVIAPLGSLSPLMRQATDWRTFASPTKSSWCQWMRVVLVLWHF